MENINKVYRTKFARKLKQYNKKMRLPYYFYDLIGSKKEVCIADIGSGPVCTIGDNWPGVDVKVYASDILQPEYDKLWDKVNEVPIIPIYKENMEKLSYPDEYFDIVHCRNAADHTPDIYKAINEMIRVCKKGGYIYLAHAPSQKKIYKGNHYWNIEDVVLPNCFKTYIEGNNLIVSICKKI